MSYWLGKYALDKGVELGKEVGPEALKTAKEMFALALKRLRQDPTGEVIAEEYEKDPKAYEKPMEKELDAAVQADPDFAQQLGALLQQYEQQAATHGVSQMVIQTRDGAVASGDGATALGAGAKQIVVGGSVGGDLTTGGHADEKL